MKIINFANLRKKEKSSIFAPENPENKLILSDVEQTKGNR